MKFEYAVGATPLDSDEAVGLIPDHINTQGELNEWEQANILEAELWLNRFSFNIPAIGDNVSSWDYGVTGQYHGSNYLDVNNLLDIAFIQQVHKRMFGKTWDWAGKFRKSNKNIGIEWINIPVQLKILLDDVVYQMANQSYEIDEIAVRLHHRLVVVHPFSNGNGRHARCITDLFLRACGQPKFLWGQGSLYENSLPREQYIKALKLADQHDYNALLKFARSGSLKLEVTV